VIVTVTPNPAIDVTLTVATLDVGEVNRTTSKHRDPAGKGINVARALAKNGFSTIAVFPADPVNGSWIVRALAEAGVESSSTPIIGEVRNNITIVDEAGRTTKINEPGPVVTPAEIHSLAEKLEWRLDENPTWLVAAGSLPVGLDADFLVDLGHRAAAKGVRYAVDTSGATLARVAASGVPDLIKPNLEELEELAGRPLHTVGDVIDAARKVLPSGEVVVSLGENGALLVTESVVLWAGHPPVVADSTVGAGDSALAGYLSIREPGTFGSVRHAALATAVAWGTAAVTLPGTTVPGPGDIDVAPVSVIDNPDRNTQIKELRA
jgi:1-phosphofructokinase